MKIISNGQEYIIDEKVADAIPNILLIELIS